MVNYKGDMVMELRDKIKTKMGYFIDLPAIFQKDDCRIFIRKGSIGIIQSMNLT